MIDCDIPLQPSQNALVFIIEAKKAVNGQENFRQVEFQALIGKAYLTH